MDTIAVIAMLMLWGVTIGAVPFIGMDMLDRIIGGHITVLGTIGRIGMGRIIVMALIVLIMGVIIDV
jgi:hypothetical protein